MPGRRLLREPLVHFIALGAVLFAIAPPSSEPGPAAPTAIVDERGPIVVNDHVRQTLIDGWQKSHSAPPTPDELSRITESWIDREILYREGIARGLDKGDARIRAWVADKMAFVLSAQTAVPDPTEAELRAFFEAHPKRFAKAELIDFVHVFVDGSDEAAKARAGKLLTLLQGGASPNGLGDTFSGGRHYRRRRIEDLARTFGDAFVRGLNEQAPGTWVIRESRFGYHVLQVLERTPAALPAFEEVMPRVKKAWHDEKQAEALADKLASLRKQWEIVIE